MKWLYAVLVLFLLASCKKDKLSIVVHNAGISGNTSAQLVDRVDADVLGISPRLVIILIGTNDVSLRVPYAQYKANVTTLITKIQEKGSKVLLLSPPPRGITEITTPQYFLNNRNDSINVILNTLSKQFNCHYLDVNSAFKAQGTPNKTANSLILNEANRPDKPDGIHLTHEGAVYIAKLVYKYLNDNGLKIPGDIVCFGDSLTRGSGYVVQLQFLLNQF
jgi:lysophospholipase L1-like esterase